MAEQTPNRAWCERLYDEQAPSLLLLGRALGLSHGEAEDVLHETFVALLKLSAEPANPAGYAVQALRRRALNFRRGWWRRLARETEAERWFDAGEGETERERAAMRALAGLPREQREVIVLKVWHGMTFEEIGAVTEASPHTAAGRYRYGVQKLRHLLRETEHHDECEPDPPGAVWFLETTKPVARPQGAVV